MAAAVAVVATLASGCSNTEKPKYEEKPVTDLYNNGLDFLAGGDYFKAAREFEEVERQHPFSIWAPRAQIMGAYAHFEADKYDDAVINIDRFIQLHPNHVDAPYAYYLKALAYYEQIVDVERDQATTEKALQALDEVVHRFPDSIYARDAQLKRDLAFDHLAGKDMSIGRYYLRSGKAVAAINRFRSVLRQYQTTSHTPEALHRLVEAYSAMGLADEAKRTGAVLGYNFPGSTWYADSYFLLTGERVVVKPSFNPTDWIEDSWDYLFIPKHAIGIVDLEAQPRRQEDLTTPVTNTGPTVASLGEFKPTPKEGANPKAPPANSKPAAPENQPALGAPAAVANIADSQTPVLPKPGSEAPASQAPATNPVDNVALKTQLASAEGQQTSAAASAIGWQKAADAAADPATRDRATQNVAIANTASTYWQARADLLRLAVEDPTNVTAKRSQEEQVARTALTYWRTVEKHGESETERSIAATNAAEAEKAIAYWKSQGRGWLGRLFRGNQ
jgi:outer membrane protein assembly factor BamD